MTTNKIGLLFVLAFLFCLEQAEAIAYIRITANRYLLRGTVTVKDSILVYEGTSYAPDGSSRKTRGEIIINSDGTYIEKEGHTIIFKKK